MKITELEAPAASEPVTLTEKAPMWFLLVDIPMVKVKVPGLNYIKEVSRADPSERVAA